MRRIPENRRASPRGNDRGGGRREGGAGMGQEREGECIYGGGFVLHGGRGGFDGLVCEIFGGGRFVLLLLLLLLVGLFGSGCVLLFFLFF